jgi:hypothetical protein
MCWAEFSNFFLLVIKKMDTTHQTLGLERKHGQILNSQYYNNKRLVDTTRSGS